MANKISEGIIIAADTIGYMNGEKFEKPKSREEAFQNIKKLSGNVNVAVTGVTMIDLYNQKQVTFYDEAKVYFNSMTDDEINCILTMRKMYILQRVTLLKPKHHCL